MNKKKLKNKIKELERRISFLEACQIPPYEPITTSDSKEWFTVKLDDEKCMFDGLKGGVYGISCPCSKCTPTYTGKVQ